MLPFTPTEFLDGFAAYNEAVWPAQPIAWALGLLALAALVRNDDRLQRLTLSLLAAMWMWTGLAYHWLFFAEINPAAVAFGLLFMVQGASLLLLAVRRPLRFRVAWRADARGFGGAALILYALLLYPLIDLSAGHWPRMPAFGISPCPVTLFTLGLLLLGRPRPPARLFTIPFVWSLIGGSAALLLGMVQDWVLLLAGPVTLLLLLRSRFDETPVGRPGERPV